MIGQNKNQGNQGNQGQESGMGVIYSSEVVPPISTRHKFGESADTAYQKNDFASYKSATSASINLNEESKQRKLLQKQRSHIVLSPITNLKDTQALESKKQSKDGNPDDPKLLRNQIKNIQLRSARNLPQLKSL